MAEVTPEIVEKVMDKIEDFYFGEGETGGEHLFNEFASRHHHLFEDGCDAEQMENKLE